METRQILLVEDEAIVAMEIMHRLKGDGYDVIHVGTGTKAISEIKTNPRIDLGPGLDGIETALDLHTTRREMKERKEIIGRSEERHRRAQQLAHFGSFEVDLETNRVLASEEARRIYGSLSRRSWSN